MGSKERLTGFIFGIVCAAVFLLISPAKETAEKMTRWKEKILITLNSTSPRRRRQVSETTGKTIQHLVVTSQEKTQSKSSWTLNAERHVDGPLKELRQEGQQRKSSWTLNAERHVDGPLKELRQEGQLVLPDKTAIENMTATETVRTYHSYLDNVDTICNRKLRMGRLGDGGWEICDDANYRPVKPCIVYSFGISNDFSFDDDTAKLYECDVSSFDPSMTQASYQRSAHVRFFKLGLGGKDEMSDSYELHTLTTFKKMLNHTGKYIDVLKMDIESAEWPSLTNMVSSGELSKVRQLLVEYHGPCSDRNNCVNQLKILKDVHDAGFRKFYVHKNHVCVHTDKLFPVMRTFCYEIHYLNINLH